MSSNKPKLKPEGKRTLLEQTLQWTTHQPINYGNPPTYFKFVKMIAVNKMFLAISRVKSFDIYRLSFEKQASYGIFFLYFASRSYKLSSQERPIQFTFNQFYNLIKFLSPSHIGIFLDGSSELKQTTPFLQLTNGKIGLDICSTDLFTIVCVKMFASRINELKCRVELFDKKESFTFDILDELDVSDIKNFAQIREILQYNVKSLELKITKAIILDRETQQLSNTTLKSIRLDCGFQKYEVFQQISNYLMKCCPNLLKLKIDANFRHKVPIEQIPSVISEYCQYMQGLKDSMLGNANIIVKFKHFIIYDQTEYDRNMVKSEFGKINFNGWEKTEENYDEFYDHALELESKKDGDFYVHFGIRSYRFF